MAIFERKKNTFQFWREYTQWNWLCKTKKTFIFSAYEYNSYVHKEVNKSFHETKFFLPAICSSKYRQQNRESNLRRSFTSKDLEREYNLFQRTANRYLLRLSKFNAISAKFTDKYQFGCGILKIFGQESTYSQGEKIKKILRGMPIYQNWT